MHFANSLTYRTIHRHIYIVLRNLHLCIKCVQSKWVGRSFFKTLGEWTAGPCCGSGKFNCLNFGRFRILSATENELIMFPSIVRRHFRELSCFNCSTSSGDVKRCIREHFAGRKNRANTPHTQPTQCRNVFEEKWKRKIGKNVPKEIIKHFQIATNNDVVSRLFFLHIFHCLRAELLFSLHIL